MKQYFRDVSNINAVCLGEDIENENLYNLKFKLGYPYQWRHISIDVESLLSNLSVVYIEQIT